MGVLDQVCDARPGRLQQLAAKYPGVRMETSLEAVLNDSLLDGVVIATPAATHYEIAKSALEAGKDVFVEKPMALRSAEVERLMELAERQQRILMVGHLLAFHPAITRLQELVESGELGRLEYIYSNRLNLGKVRREENALWSFAPHDISVILLLLKDLPIQVAATGGLVYLVSLRSLYRHRPGRYWVHRCMIYGHRRRPPSGALRPLRAAAPCRGAAN